MPRTLTLFARNYGRRAYMDEESKQLLERNLFTQGLLLKWQEKALPLPATMFVETLYKARTLEKQDRQLAQIHQPSKAVLLT